MQYLYQAFGMLIQSEIPLSLAKNKPEQVVPAISEQAGTVCSGNDEIQHQVFVKIGRVGLSSATIQQFNYALGRIRYTVSPRSIQLHIPHTGNFLVENMAAITVDPYPETDEQMISLYITVIILPFLLRRKPILTLHGSAAIYPLNSEHQLHKAIPSAALFLGTKGSGKSTTAAALSQHGWKMLCDDLVPIEPGPRILSGIPIAKLLPDAFQVLIGNPEAAAHLFDGVSKYQVEIPGGLSAASLKTLYILQTGDVSSVHIEPLAGQEKIRRIIAHTIKIDGLDTSAEIFHRITDYFSSVKTYLVIRPVNSGSPGEIAEAIRGKLD